MTWEIVAIALGLLVGLSLGALGGGGSTLAVPILVFVAGLTAQDATSASLVVVGTAAAIGVVGHLRHGNVRLGAGLAFGAAGIVGSRIGLVVNRSLDENVLLLAFSALIVYVAVRMYRSVESSAPASATVQVATASRPDGVDGPDGPGRVGGPDARDRGAGAPGAVSRAPVGVATRERTVPTAGLDLSAPALAKLAGAATLVGLLTGLFGVGGGFAVVPALTLLLKFPAKQAIGTSLVVIAMNAAIALAMRVGDLGFDWGVVVPFLLTVTVGVLVGTRVAADVDSDRLTRAFAVMLGVVALFTAASTVLGS